jgi:Tfp pilus assembly protein PilX
MALSPPASPRRGFALVLSLTIMSLLVLVILSLAGFLAIESRLADSPSAMPSPATMR